jgi:hypothetical protein
VSFPGGTARVWLPGRRVKWWHLVLGVVGLAWFGALLWWSLASG